MRKMCSAICAYIHFTPSGAHFLLIRIFATFNIETAFHYKHFVLYITLSFAILSKIAFKIGRFYDWDNCWVDYKSKSTDSKNLLFME